MKNDLKADHRIEVRYQRAQVLCQDMNEIALNTTLVPHWIDETEFFWYRRATKSGTRFRLVDSTAATNYDAFDHQAFSDALAKASGKEVDYENLPITKVAITLTPKQVSFSAFDSYYIFKSEESLCEKICLKSLPDEWVVSPDGKKAAFIRDYNLWVRYLDTDQEQALTRDGEQYYSYASIPSIWGFSVGLNMEALWSPNSKRLLTVQVDNRQVKSTPVVHHVPQDGSLRPFNTEYRSAYPGDECVEENRLLAIDIETGMVQEANYRRIPTNRSGYGFFTDNLGWWGNDSRHAYFVDTERGEQVARVVEFDTQSGATRLLFKETSATYINLSPSEATVAALLPLPESNELIWYSERSGWAHLYLYSLETGELKNPITQGGWVVREVLHFDAEQRELFFQAGGRVADRDPYYLDICRVHVDTGEITTLASSDHEYTVLAPRCMTFQIFKRSDPDLFVNTTGISPSTRYLVATRSRVDQVPVSLLLDRKGKIILELETADVSGLPEGWQWPEPVKLMAVDDKTDIYGVVLRPSDFSPDKQYPVIDCSASSAEFACVPKGSFTNAVFGGEKYFQAAAIAELGFIVVIIDGRGTAYRDRDFIDYSYGRVPSSNHPPDRIAGIKQLAVQYPYMDISRVGIMGFTGTLGAVYGLLEYPEFYKVGVAHAPQDTRLMATVWGEQYEGIAPTTAGGKQAEQLVENLQGKLLLMHGLLDSMCPPAGTFRLVEAFQKANKDFDMLILPNEGLHVASGYAFRRTWDYFVTHLQGIEPPKEFKLTHHLDLLREKLPPHGSSNQE